MTLITTAGLLPLTFCQNKWTAEILEN